MGQISWGRASRGCCQFGTWVRTDSCSPKLALISAWRALCRSWARQHACQELGPASQQGGGHQGERQRCRHAWPHTLPGQPGRGLGQPEGLGALGACQVHSQVHRQTCNKKKQGAGRASARPISLRQRGRAERTQPLAPAMYRPGFSAP